VRPAVLLRRDRAGPRRAAAVPRPDPRRRVTRNPRPEERRNGTDQGYAGRPDAGGGIPRPRGRAGRHHHGSHLPAGRGRDGRCGGGRPARQRGVPLTSGNGDRGAALTSPPALTLSPHAKERVMTEPNDNLALRQSLAVLFGLPATLIVLLALVVYDHA